MNFIEDFNIAFDSLVGHYSKKRDYNEDNFVRTGYLWVFLGWFISLLLVLAGYFFKGTTGEMTIFFVVTILAFFVKGISDTTSPYKERNSTFILISIPFLGFMLYDMNTWLILLGLYLPAVMLSKNLRVAMQYKFYNISEKMASINLSVALVSFYLPVHLIFKGRMSMDASALLIAFMLYIGGSSFLSFMKGFSGKKDNNLLSFSTSGLVFIIITKEIVTYLSKFFLYY